MGIHDSLNGTGQEGELLTISFFVSLFFTHQNQTLELTFQVFIFTPQAMMTGVKTFMKITALLQASVMYNPIMDCLKKVIFRITHISKLCKKQGSSKYTYIVRLF